MVGIESYFRLNKKTRSLKQDGFQEEIANKIVASLIFLCNPFVTHSWIPCYRFSHGRLRCREDVSPKYVYLQCMEYHSP